jgi:bifunctional non-homologous end joining protein LigD
LYRSQVSPANSTAPPPVGPPPGGGPPDDDPLARYRGKRTAGSTPEPIGSGPVAGRGGSIFVVHEHVATRHHWDLRLEIDGVLVSWAVPRAPSMNPDEKRLAVKVENHPLEYAGFEAVIPEGNYGAGAMIVWDRGRFAPVGDPADGLRGGEVKFELHGYKLRGAFTLVHTGRSKRSKGGGAGSNEWLLIKKRDTWSDAFIARGEPLAATSVLSGLTTEELAGGDGRIAALRAVLAALPDAAAPRRAIDPATWKPMLIETADAPFSSPDWIFELKYDGYRLTAFGGSGQARLRYRSGIDASERFPELAAAIRALPVPGLVLDGEVVVTDGEGRPVFQLLQQRTQLARNADIQRASGVLPATFFAFDLLGADGRDLRGLPLAQRKALTQRLMPTAGPLRYADHVDEQGEALFAQVLARGLEGVVAKKKDAPYRCGVRSRDWLRFRQEPEADFAVCGFTPPKGNRSGLGALHLCVRDPDGSWVYAGKVGTGLDDRDLAFYRKELTAAAAWEPPWPMPERSAGTRWVEPHLVVQVRYREWPGDHLVRLPVFVRRRPDKQAADCRRVPDVRAEGHAAPVAHDDAPPPAPDVVHEAAPRELRLSNLGKVFWPDDGYTKGDLVTYYRELAPWILPYLVDRPLVLTRYPDGIDGKWFYQKDMPDWTPPWLRTVSLWSESTSREINYVLIDDADGLAFVANLGSIPIHVWASRTADLGRPDWTIIDLDPKGAPREHVVPLALAVRELCESLGLPSYVKTSGQTGLHVLIPLGGLCTYEQARTLAYLLSMVVERRFPAMATTLRNPASRGGRVYLDWGQNAHGQLLVAPFSVRPVTRAAVSMPLTWDEVVPGLDPRQFHIKNARARMEALGEDPVRPVLTGRPDLGDALERLGVMLGAVA